MTASSPVHLILPPELYAQIQKVAAGRAQSLETVLLESLGLLFNVPSVDQAELSGKLETLSEIERSGVHLEDH